MLWLRLFHTRAPPLEKRQLDWLFLIFKPRGSVFSFQRIFTTLHTFDASNWVEKQFQPMGGKNKHGNERIGEKTSPRCAKRNLRRLKLKCKNSKYVRLQTAYYFCLVVVVSFFESNGNFQVALPFTLKQIQFLNIIANNLRVEWKVKCFCSEK